MMPAKPPDPAEARLRPGSNRRTLEMFHVHPRHLDQPGRRRRGAAQRTQLLRDVLAGRPANLLGDPAMPHSLTFVPDHARCMAALALEDAAYGEAWHTPNPPVQSLRQVLEQVAAQGGHPLRMRVAGRWLLRALGLFKPEMREHLEMLYQFERPTVVDSGKIERRFGLQAALQQTLDALKAKTA